MIYALPMVFVGFGGMINDMLSRLVFQHVTDLPAAESEKQLGIFGANYRLAVLITIFIQMFRLAAEPFFFNQSKNKDAPETYARVMKLFVIACSYMFLFVGVYLNIFKHIMTLKYPEYGEGIGIVPILAFGGVCLGIYYNLSIWYKLKDKNWFGAAITFAGALITILLNIWWIPIYGYMGSAWATFICYAFMMLSSYFLGQKYYPIPYEVGKISIYLFSITALTAISIQLNQFIDKILLQFLLGSFLIIVFSAIVYFMDRKELQSFPLLGKYIK
jgi:O-antigen/teichoic acid export membrane protein